ncbi:1-deoxy-D-xylulose-5-phosphate reductoisomerase [Clostridium sp. HCP1S3_B4]|uniref:1-deoxy-D-xylulose-5-phosphate reductoisomerase n=1 Tax=unclassified Clostridium TaxID=2614128 RepID=UPI002A7AB073|nr:1-deoxy-D-xylulose-5-phosphate reductoisomerase [Clostridiales bacterium]MDY2728985.1 1-deoxy-D-xylulose-5-phosphate reductoisomerase [Clostridium sp.]
MKFVSILGATGSIGTQTLDVIRKEKDNFKLVGITANSSVKKIIEIIREFKPEHVAMMDEKSAEDVKEFCMENNFNTNVYSGIDGLVKVATVPSATMVVTSVVGMIGLVPTIEAIKKGKDIALANKETLVVAGEIVMKLAKENNVKILPVDSEHGAIFQCLRGNEYKDLKNIILTASGGPFRGKTYDELKHITVKEALNHPNWSMGKKITIDSATLMNKGLEVIEAHFLFNCPYDNIKPIVHKESIVHSMVEYKDGSVIAQLASADMRLPIQYAMNYPKREKAVAKTIDFYEISKLTFEKPDYDTFKCLRLAFEAGKKAGLMPTILNGANEVAVDLFLKEKIKFLDIADIIEDAMNYFEKESKEELTIDNIISLDKKVRKYVLEKFS